jgi:molybdopterin-guanine dinucleotide biosynthesis protein MobB
MRSGRVLGVAGWQRAGKTTLLASAATAWRERGLSVAVLAHAHHEIRVDPPGTDSDRLHRAGADVLLAGAVENLERRRPDTDQAPEALATHLLRGHDVVLVEGWKSAPHPKAWLLRPGETEPPAGLPGVELVLPWGPDRLATFLAWAEPLLQRGWATVERYGAVLVGGRSRRMGRPKEALEVGGRTLLERATEALAAAGPVVWLGGDAADAPPAEVRRLPDVPGVAGPLGGLLAALRWAPDRVWVVAPCDLPRLSSAAVDWLLAQRAPGRWAVLPRVGGEVQPLLAVYEPMALGLLEELVARGAPAPSRLAGHPRVASPEPPAQLAPAWRGVNTPAELTALLGE